VALSRAARVIPEGEKRTNESECRSGFLGNLLQIDTNASRNYREAPPKRRRPQPRDSTKRNALRARIPARASVSHERVPRTLARFILGVCHRPCTRRRRMLLRVLNTCGYYFPFGDRAFLPRSRTWLSGEREGERERERERERGHVFRRYPPRVHRKSSASEIDRFNCEISIKD